MCWSRRSRPAGGIHHARHLDVRRGELRADQHDDGQPPALRHVAPGRAAGLPGARAPQEPDAVDGHPVHHCAGAGADHPGGAGGFRSHPRAGGHHRVAAAGRVCLRQRRGAGPAPRQGQA
ncbi:hypothetical protein G6F31_020212 [Rhizopus arrhizus]|nr:hypothetical protein G6F31_020212 [Rhizopus arrhizus]